MSKVITFSREYPSYHPKAGQPTFFVEKVLTAFILNGIDIKQYKKKVPLSFLESLSGNIVEPKHHTIRKGHRFKAGDYFSPRVWGNDVNSKSGRSGPYHSSQIIIGPDIKIERTINVGVFSISEDGSMNVGIDLVNPNWKEIAKNDGLLYPDLVEWFRPYAPFEGQIIIWTPNTY